MISWWNILADFWSCRITLFGLPDAIERDRYVMLPSPQRQKESCWASVDQGLQAQGEHFHVVNPCHVKQISWYI